MFDQSDCDKVTDLSKFHQEERGARAEDACWSSCVRGYASVSLGLFNSGGLKRGVTNSWKLQTKTRVTPLFVLIRFVCY